MKNYILNESNYRFLGSNNIDLAILPWGATEPHNFHLSYGTDSLETSFITEKSAEKAVENGAAVMVLPCIPFGMQNPGQTDLPFCLHSSVETQMAILKDIVDSLNRQGIRKLLIVNGHGGNDFKPLIRDLYTRIDGFFIVSMRIAIPLMLDLSKLKLTILNNG
ncbi:MAG: creatininase family protein [Eudoraea sp.]|nr:creatininase family protein [Eudoraea sp.]